MSVPDQLRWWWMDVDCCSAPAGLLSRHPQLEPALHNYLAENYQPFRS